MVEPHVIVIALKETFHRLCYFYLPFVPCESVIAIFVQFESAINTFFYFNF